MFQYAADINNYLQLFFQFKGTPVTQQKCKYIQNTKTDKKINLKTIKQINQNYQ